MSQGTLAPGEILAELLTLETRIKQLKHMADDHSRALHNDIYDAAMELPPLQRLTLSNAFIVTVRNTIENRDPEHPVVKSYEAFMEQDLGGWLYRGLADVQKGLLCIRHAVGGLVQAANDEQLYLQITPLLQAKEIRQAEQVDKDSPFQ